MSSIPIQRTHDNCRQRLNIFRTIAERLQRVRRRAFELYEQRGRRTGHDLEDWVRAEHEIMGCRAAQLTEINGEYEIEVALPGFLPSQIGVAASSTAIAVHARGRPEATNAPVRVLWSNFGSRDVYRLFQMPQQIDACTAQATLDRGMLKIIVAKEVSSKAKPLAIAKACSRVPALWVAA